MTPGMCPSLFINFSLTAHSLPLCHVLWHHIYLFPLLYPLGPTVLHNCLSFHFPFPIGSSLEWPLWWNDLLSPLFSSPLLWTFATSVFCPLFSLSIFFPQTKKSRNSFRIVPILHFRHIFVCCALLLLLYAMARWMDRELLSHFSPAFCLHQPSCQVTRLKSQLIPPNTVCCRKYTNLVTWSWKMRWNKGAHHQLEYSEVSVSVCIYWALACFCFPSLFVVNRWAKAVISSVL